ncbi:MAG: sensor histidine kinase [Bacillota bacterium]
MKTSLNKRLFFSLIGSGISLLLLLLEWTHRVYSPAYGQGLLFIIFILFVLHALAERKTRQSVQEITEDIEKILEGNVNTRVFITGNQDLSYLASLLNKLAGTLQKVEIDYKTSEESRKILLSNISHDLRTPLTSIIGYIDALRDGIADSKEEQDEYLEILHIKAARLKYQVDNIFYMAKLDADDIPMSPEIINLSEVLRECIIDFMPEIQNQRIELTIDIQEDNARVYGDRLSLLRIINNLLGNCLAHGKDGKVIGIELLSAPKAYQVSIWDKGPGIHPQHIPYIFNRLYTADRARRSSKSGSGLGLAIVKKLLERHKGQIWVESVPFEKTSFTFTIPKL